MQRITIVFVLIAGLLANVTACTHPVRRLIFQPHKIDHLPAFPAYVDGLERFWLQSGQERIEGWLLQRGRENRMSPGAAVMIAHGNRELIDHYLKRAIHYRKMGFTVLLGEYRGYGRSGGEPSRKGIREDYLRFYDMLAALPGVDANRIIFHGRSLGGAVIADLVPHRRPAAVILESTFSSIKAMANGAPNFLLSDRYDTVAALAEYEGPVLILHGKRDRVVPVSHARHLQAQLPGAEIFIGNFGHNDLPPDWKTYWSVIRRFLKNHQQLSTPVLKYGDVARMPI